MHSSTRKGVEGRHKLCVCVSMLCVCVCVGGGGGVRKCVCVRGRRVSDTMDVG